MGEGDGKRGWAGRIKSEEAKTNVGEDTASSTSPERRWGEGERGKGKGKRKSRGRIVAGVEGN